MKIITNRFVVGLIFFLGQADQGLADFESESETIFRQVTSGYELPAGVAPDPSLRTGGVSQTVARETHRLYLGDRYVVEASILASFVLAPGGQFSIGGSSTDQTNHGRSEDLKRRWHSRQNSTGDLELDLMNLQINRPWGQLKLGRQSINLATTYFFTPNDLFAPFFAQTFFRAYKPGVDALIVDYAVGELSELSLYAVAGYEDVHNEDSTQVVSRWSSEATSLLLRYRFSLGLSELGLMGGKFGKDGFFGYSGQGGFVGEMTYRFEGNYQQNLDDSSLKSSQVSLGLEKQINNELLVQGELFENSRGYTEKEHYSRVANDSNPPRYYMGRHYGAVSASYQISPLWSGRYMILANLSDQSTLASVYHRYSLSDDSDLAFGLNLPKGEIASAAEGGVSSEFGPNPRLLSVETTVYF